MTISYPGRGQIIEQQPGTVECCLSVLEVRLSTLRPGRHRLFEVLGRHAHEHLIAIFEVDGRRQATAFVAAPQDPLGHRDAVGAPRIDLLGHGDRAFEEHSVGVYLGNQSHSQRGGRIIATARQQDLAGVVQPDAGRTVLAMENRPAVHTRSGCHALGHVSVRVRLDLCR